MTVINRTIGHFLLLLMLLPGICLASEPQEKMLTHVVIAWLKPEFRTEEFMQKLLKANARLREIPQVQSLQFGNAIESERKTVDDSFDLANVMTFRSEQDVKDYLAHPIHVEFIDKYIKGKTEKTIVYDF